LTLLILNGKVITGQGNGRKYIQLPWVKQQIEKNIGFPPFLGTLNIELTEESAKKKRLLGRVKSTIIYPEEGFCVGLLFNATIAGIHCVVVIPQVESYPKDLLEIVARSNLRETLNLKNGDLVRVAIRS
jgi:riboflavin kinase